MYEHINELRVRIFHIAISIAIITIFCLSFGLKPLNDSLLFYPVPDPIHNIAVQLTSYMSDTLLPPEVKLIQTAPGQAFLLKYTWYVDRCAWSMPIIIKEIFGFISPAFERKFNKSLIVTIILPTIALFISGIILSHVLVIPFTLGFCIIMVKPLELRHSLTLMISFHLFYNSFLIWYRISTSNNNVCHFADWYD